MFLQLQNKFHFCPTKMRPPIFLSVGVSVSKTQRGSMNPLDSFMPPWNLSSSLVAVPLNSCSWSLGCLWTRQNNRKQKEGGKRWRIFHEFFLVVCVCFFVYGVQSQRGGWISIVIHDMRHIKSTFERFPFVQFLQWTRSVSTRYESTDYPSALLNPGSLRCHSYPRSQQLVW